MLFPTAQQANLPACSSHGHLMLSFSREAVNINFKVIGLTRLGIKPKSTAPEADVLTTRLMAQPQWPASGQASLQLFKTNLRWHISSHCAMHCLNLSASAAVKVSAMQNAENIARKVVKMFKTSAKKTALLKSCIKEDVSSQGETKRYFVGLCETRFVKCHVLIPAKHSKLGVKKKFQYFNKVCPKTVQNAPK